MTNWHAYEQRKAAWTAAHPGAAPEEYEQAARREFRGDQSRKPSGGVAPQSEKRAPHAPGLRPDHAGQL